VRGSAESCFGFGGEGLGSAAERGANKLNGFEDFSAEDGSSQGHNLALTG